MSVYSYGTAPQIKDYEGYVTIRPHYLNKKAIIKDVTEIKYDISTEEQTYRTLMMDRAITETTAISTTLTLTLYESNSLFRNLETNFRTNPNIKKTFDIEHYTGRYDNGTEIIYYLYDCTLSPITARGRSASSDFSTYEVKINIGRESDSLEGNAAANCENYFK